MKWYLAHTNKKEVWINMELVTALMISPENDEYVRIYFQGGEDHVDVNGPIDNILNDVLPGNTVPHKL